MSDYANHLDGDRQEAPVWLLSPDGALIECLAGCSNALIGTAGIAGSLGTWAHPVSRDPYPPDLNPGIFAAPSIMSKMSGSPIIVADGSSVGVITGRYTQSPRLTQHLPGWLLDELRRRVHAIG